jgi:uncharacterized protein DUF2442
MKSETLGTSTSEVEVSQISKHGIWLLLQEREHFLSFDDFPWFKNASVSAIHSVEVLNENHLYWPDLDIDLAVESIEHPQRFPLVSSANEIVFGLGFANLPNGVDVHALESSLIVEGNEIRIYGLNRSFPGVIRAAAFDLTLVLSAAGSVASLAALLWMAYERFIAPKKSKEQDDGGIYIVISRPDGTIENFWIGNTEKEREVFISKFSKTVTDVRTGDDPSFWRSAVAEIEETEFWVRQRR